MVLSKQVGQVGLLAATSMLVCAQAAAQVQPLPAPSHWYRFDGNLADSVGSAHGTPIGPLQFAGDGVCGGALVLSPGAEASFGAAVGNIGLGDFTLAFWVKAPPTLVVRQAYAKRASCEVSGSYLDLRFTENNVVLDLFGNGQFAGLSAEAFLFINTWRSLTITRAGDTMSIYVNGQGLQAVHRPIVPLTNTAPFRLGGGPCVGTEGIEALVGEVDELLVFDVALTPVQAFHLHQQRFLTVIHQPSSTTGCVGGSAEFAAGAAPGEAVTFQWQAEFPLTSGLWRPLSHGGPGLGPQTTVSITAGPGASTSTLRLSSLHEMDATRYRCLVTYACGGAVSVPVSLALTNCCTADFNGDGFRNPDDLADFITCFFLDVQFPAICPAADFNGDGFRDPDDLADFITGFFLSTC